MSSQPPFADPSGPQPTEEELRAAYEAQLKQLRVEDLVVETVVSLLNLGGRKAGLAPGTEDERDAEQVRLAVEGVRALLPLVEEPLGPNAAQLREALAQLQRAYVQLSGGEPSGGGEGGPTGGPTGGQEPPATPQDPDGPGPAQSSGRLWVPGQ
jgi:hypothetical protein